MQQGRDARPDGAQELIHDWNAGEAPPLRRRVSVYDESLRDGLQTPEARDPEAAAKRALLDAMEAAGIDAVDLGLPGAGEHQRRDIEELARHLMARQASLIPHVACRATETDLTPAAAIAQRVGRPLHVDVFIAASRLRHRVEGWSLDEVCARVRSSLRFARAAELPVVFVTEDSTRAHPHDLEQLYGLALDEGATRIVVCDTVGHATPQGAAALTAWMRSFADGRGHAAVGLDWHGHRDRGLGLANALAAVAAGADRVHGTALGLGERAGNVPMELLLANLALGGQRPCDLESVVRYVESASRHLGSPVPPNHPLFGSDVFRTASGVHAAAILKALEAQRPDLADRVYSPLPAAALGRRQGVALGFCSGRANVRWWLLERGLNPQDEGLVERIFNAIKSARRPLNEAELGTLLAPQSDPKTEPHPTNAAADGAKGRAS